MTGSSTVAAMAPIVAAEVFEIEVAFVTPYKLAEGTLATTSAVLLKLVDADGVVGWGEANANVHFTGESPRDAARALADRLLPAVFAAPVPEPGRIDVLLDGLVAGHLCAKGAVTMALFDILGKRLGVPVASLLGGSLRDRLPVLWPLGNGTADDDMRVIDRRAPEGFKTFMLKMGTSPVAEEIRRVRDLEVRYGDTLAFIADVNQGWSLDEARAFLRGIAGSRLVFVEQPVEKDAVADLASLKSMGCVAISADESVIGMAEAAHLAGMGAVDIFSIKSSKNGGPLRAQRIANVAEAFGIRCYMNSMMEFGITQASSLQHAMTVRNLVDAGHAFMSTLRLAEDPTDFSAFVRDGIVSLPQRPGLGIEVDEAHVRRLAVAGEALRA